MNNYLQTFFCLSGSQSWIGQRWFKNRFSPGRRPRQLQLIWDWLHRRRGVALSISPVGHHKCLQLVGECEKFSAAPGQLLIFPSHNEVIVVWLSHNMTCVSPVWICYWLWNGEGFFVFLPIWKTKTAKIRTKF